MMSKSSAEFKLDEIENRMTFTIPETKYIEALSQI